MYQIKMTIQEARIAAINIAWTLKQFSNSKTAVSSLLKGKQLKTIMEYAHKSNDDELFDACLDICEYKIKPYFVNRRGIK